MSPVRLKLGTSQSQVEHSTTESLSSQTYLHVFERLYIVYMYYFLADQPVVVKVPMEVRRFEYTRQQWTGKSPKQFLIDWCRKHLPKSPPPKFEKLFERANKFRCKYVILLFF